MIKRLLLTSALIAPSTALADTVTIGYFDPSVNNGIQILSSVSGPVTSTSPINQIIDHPLLVGSGFGFDQIIAMVIPPTGNVFSGGLGGPNPTFEFAFNDGFVPIQGGTIYLYATWTGSSLTGNPFTFPTTWGTTEMPPANGRTFNYTVTSQVLVCDTPNPFCGPFVGGGTVIGQDSIHDIVQTNSLTLTGVLPNPAFKITEVFAVTGIAGPPQGDIGAFMETTLVSPSVPGPIVGAGIPGLIASVFGLLALSRRRKRT